MALALHLCKPEALAQHSPWLVSEQLAGEGPVQQPHYWVSTTPASRWECRYCGEVRDMGPAQPEMPTDLPRRLQGKQDKALEAARERLARWADQAISNAKVGNG
jgi:hypothetical protein